MHLEGLSLVLLEFQSRNLVVLVGIGLTEFISKLLHSRGLDVFLELHVLRFEGRNVLDASLVELLLLECRCL